MQRSATHCRGGDLLGGDLLLERTAAKLALQMLGLRSAFRCNILRLTRPCRSGLGEASALTTLGLMVLGRLGAGFARRKRNVLLRSPDDSG